METNKQKGKILVVDDEADICEVLRFNLENEGFEVATAPSAEIALQLLANNEYHLILLDVMMGGMSGFQLAQYLRSKGNQTPIIFLTAKDTENDMLTGFSVGGDDYISKPFSVKEIIARAKAILKRAGEVSTPEKKERIIVDGMEINFEKKQLLLNKEEIVLTKKEFEILALLSSNQGRVYSREEILDRVWKNDAYVLDRTVDVHITRLRKKLGVYGTHIINRTGYGYCFN